MVFKNQSNEPIFLAACKCKPLSLDQRNRNLEDRFQNPIIIVDAFNRLISKHELVDITSTMIAQEAGVSKSTFYRHFDDKYDVMNCNFKELLDDCVIHSGNYRDMFLLLFQRMEAEWKPLLKAFNSTGINSLENYIYTYSKEIALTITKQNRGGKGMTPEELFQTDMICLGISHIYRNWANGDYTLSPKTAADLLYSMIPQSLKHSWSVDAEH